MNRFYYEIFQGDQKFQNFILCENATEINAKRFLSKQKIIFFIYLEQFLFSIRSLRFFLATITIISMKKCVKKVLTNYIV